MEQMKRRIIHAIIHYKLWVSTLVLICSLIAHALIKKSCRTHTFSPFTNGLVPEGPLILFAVKITAAFLVVASIIIPVMYIHYRDATGGRSFLRDRRDTGRTYWDLIRYYKDSDPYQIKEKKLPIQDWKASEGVILGRVGDRLIRRPSEAPGNIFIAGLPGSQKTTTIIACTALRFGAVYPETGPSYYSLYGEDGFIKTKASVVCIDLKGDVIHWTREKRPIKIFDPEDPHSIHFDPFYGIKNLSVSEQRVFLDGMADIIVQEDKGEGGKYFTEGARDYFTGVSLLMLHENRNTSFMEVVDGILHGNAFDWVTRVCESNCDEAKDYLASYFGSNEKNVAGCYNAISKSLRPFKTGALPYLLKSDDDCVSVDMIEDGWDIYIELKIDRLPQYSSCVTLLLQQLMNALMARPDSATGVQNRPVIFLLDELPKLSFSFHALETCLSTMRSKQVTCCMASQSISQAQDKYGEHAFDDIIDCCQYVVCTAAMSPKNRKWWSEMIGSRKILKRSTSSSEANSGISAQETREPILEPEAFGNLQDKIVIYSGGEGYIIADKCKVYE